MKNRKNRKDTSQNVPVVKRDTMKFQNKDLEIDNILEETHFLTEKGEMQETAKKYKARPKMDEIFSNASKEVRLKNSNPLDVDDEQLEVDNALADEDTDTTLRAQLVMEDKDEELPEIPEKNEENAEETSSDEEEQEIEEELPEVTLKSEYDENTKFADDVIDNIDEFRERNVTLTDCDSIDVGFDTAEKETEKAIKNFSDEAQKENAKKDKKADKQPKNPEVLKKEIKGNYEKLFGIKKPKNTVIISKIPVYTREEKVDKVHIKAGKFSDVVRNEYEEYLKADPRDAVSVKIEPEDDIMHEVEQVKQSVKEKIMGAVVGFFSTEEQQIAPDVPEEKIETVNDYNSKEDEKSILFEINTNIRRLFMRSMVMLALSIVAVIITILVRSIPQTLCSAILNAPVVYAVVNLILIGVTIAVNRVTILSGLTPLVRIKGNSDTALAVGAVAGGIQAIVSFFFIIGATTFSINYYSVIVIIAFFANNLGKLFMVLRVKDNFKFVCSNAPKYSAKIYTDEVIASKMMSGTVVERPIVAYQHKTGFLSNFLKISYAPDPSEELAGKLAPVTVLCSLVVAVVYGALFKSFDGAVNAFAVMTAISIPICTLLAVNIPLRILCKKLLKSNAMVSSYPSVKQFCDTSAVMADAKELYPEGCVVLDGIKTFVSHGADDAILSAAAILKEAESPMAAIFNEALDKGQGLPEVESVLYEDGMGLLGWVNSERILIGSRTLMEKYNINTPSSDYEEKYHYEGKEIAYLSKAGQLVAMFVVKYHADPQVASELRRGELNGLSFLVRTTDCNITSEKIADDFGIFFRSVKILPTGLGSVCKEVREQTEETSRAYLATRGKFSSLVRSVAGCVKMGSNISLSVVIQLISIILGMLLSGLLCLYAGVGVLGTGEMLLYSLFWGVAAVIAPLIKKS